MEEINDYNKRPVQGAYTDTTSYNAIDAQIKQKIDSYVNTTFVARIDSCSTESTGGTKTVNVTPMIAQTDANGNALASPSLQELAHYRVQAGKAALIINPVAGDLGVFCCSKSDSSGLNANSTTTQVPASFRKYNPSDAVMLGTIHTQQPTVYIELTQDDTINIVAPTAYNLASPTVTIVANTAVNITAPTVAVNGNLVVRGTITSTGDMVTGGISMQEHTHGGVRTGGGSTGAPNR